MSQTPASDTPSPGHRGDADHVEHVVELLRERLYGAISCLATLAVLSRDTHGETNAWARVVDVVVSAGGLWAASLLAAWVAYLAVHGQGPRGMAALAMLKTSRQILVAAAAPTVILIAAGIGWLEAGIALSIALWLVVIELGLIALLAVRRTNLRWWQQLIAVGTLTGLGVLVVALKTLTH
ncbi:hypothetical protein BH11ACT6_BH11ACT6_17560 [soil metagenome]